ncbi:TonB-dependent receptor [Marinilabiliaceae bacterium JC017]|nr:TonB-dependent receptor [Marinilabiliaceae bacterium JC017]
MKKLILLVMLTMAFVQLGWSQTRMISGLVKDKSGEPIPGVNVFWKTDPTHGTITSIDGKYSLQVTNETTIVFQFVGMKTQEVVVGAKNSIDPTMEDEYFGLDEVIAVGYGSQKKANLTGSVASIDVEKNLEARPVTDVARGLQGTTSGLTITTNTGDLGANPNIQLRGMNGSLNTDSNPLILVDNVEVPNLMMINPDDVESVSVLKDAAASSIYGSRGAWGVILIKTKSGSTEGKNHVTYSNNFSWSTPTEIPNMAGTVEGAEMAFLSARRSNPNKTIISCLGMNVDEVAIQKMQEWRDNYSGKDLGSEMVMGRDFEKRDGKMFYYRPWDVKDLFLKEWTPQQNHNINVNGGNDKNSYNVSLGYLGQSGSLKAKPDEYARYNATISIRSKLKDWMEFRAKGMMSKSNLKTPYSYSGYKADAWYYLLRWPKYYPYGTYEGKPFRSAISEMEQAGMNKKTESFNRINVGSTFTLAKGLTLDADYTYTENNIHEHQPGGYAEAYNFWGGNGVDNTFMRYTSSSKDMVNYVSNWDEINTFKAFATYVKDIDSHSFKFMAGTDVEDYEYWKHNSQRRDLIFKEKPELKLATGEQFVGGGRSQWATMGYFGRINYAFKDKYLVEFNGRYDGSSRFPSNDRWAFFPSASVGYRISEEPFMQFAEDYLSSLKFRGSWGSIGNHNIDRKHRNLFLATMASNESDWLVGGNNMLTMGMPRVVPESLTWETVTTLDFGLDARMFDNKFGVVFDWYQRTTSDMVTIGAKLPESFGASAPKKNCGELTTTGWEVSLDWNHRFINGLNLNVTATVFDFQEEITKFDSESKGIYGNYEGKKLGEIWGYETDRFFAKSDFKSDASGNLIVDENGHYVMKEGIPSQEAHENGWFFYGPGDVKYKDLDGNGVIDYGAKATDDHGDLKVIGNSTPRYQYSFRIGADWKGFDLDLFFHGVGKRDYWANGPVFIPGYRPGEGWYEHQQDYWTPENPNAFYPRPTSHDWTNNARNFLRQSKYLLNMSYLRCKNLTFGYTLPKNLVSKVGVEKLRVYFSGENLFEFTNLKLPIDPETGERGDAYGFAFGRSYPYRRTVSFGLQLSL